jgi:protein-tyrosine phosphatase
MPSVRAASAGYLAPAGRRSPETAVMTARALGVDLDDHRSVLLDARTMDEADIVFLFDSHNLARVARDYPQHRGKLHLLGSLTAHGAIEIADPYGADDDVFEHTYARIAASIDALASGLSATQTATSRAGVGDT